MLQSIQVEPWIIALLDMMPLYAFIVHCPLHNPWQVVDSVRAEEEEEEELHFWSHSNPSGFRTRSYQGMEWILHSSSFPTHRVRGLGDGNRRDQGSTLGVSNLS